MVNGPAAVLIGPPGAGKSTVGALLAQLVGAPFVDTDEMVTRRAGASIADLFVDFGEAHFRDLERACVRDALAEPGAVVSLGGGAVLDDAAAAALADLPVAFLDVTIRQASRRSGFDQGRPLLALNPRGQWLQLMAARRPVYERLARVRVDTDGKDPEQVAWEVGRALALPGLAAGGRAP